LRKLQIHNPLTKMKLNRQLILLFVILVSPVFLLNWYANNQTERILKEHVTNAYMELNKQNHLLINRDIETVSRVMTNIIINPVVQQLQSGAGGVYDEPNQYDRVKLYETADKLIPTFSIGITGGDAVGYYLYVYDPENKYNFAPYNTSRYRNGGVFFYTDLTKPSWVDEAIAGKGRGYLKILSGIGNEGPTLAYIRAVNSAISGKLIVGALVASNMDKKIGQSLRSVSLPDNGEMFLTDYDNTILASTVAGSMGRKLDLPASMVEGTKGEETLDDVGNGYIYVQHADYEIRQKLVYRIPAASLLRQQSELKRAIQWISMAYSLFGIVVMAYFWRSLLFPLQRLAGFVRGYEPGRKVPSSEEAWRNDEVGVLIHAIYSMARRINSLVEDRYVMDIKQKETQLQVLYQQINPHLLYNTLESIYWKSSLEGNSDSAEMIKELSKLMRISLSRGRELITLQEELEHATAYTRLQQKRYEYEFEVRWETDEEALPNLIPKITLQPLIENAIMHGVRNMGEDGLIVVRAFRREERVVVEVEDNGYKPVDHEALNRTIREPGTDNRSGYGIHNVHERIQLHFGSEYGIRYSLPPGGGTLVTIELPARQAEAAPAPADAG